MQVIYAPQLSASQDYYEKPYDLVEGKPFFIRAGFHKLSKNIGSETVFNPVIRINGEVKQVECKNQMPGSGNTNCSFTGSDFSSENKPQGSEGHYGAFNQVFVIPKNMLKEGVHTIEVDLYPDNNQNYFPCDYIRFHDTFTVEVHKIQSPRIGLAVANCEDITGCTTPTNIKDFLDSKEIDLFDTLFPVSEGDQKFFQEEYRARIDQELKQKLKQKLEQESNQISNQKKYESILSLALGFKLLSSQKISFGYDYLIGIGSTDFFTSNTPGFKSFLWHFWSSFFWFGSSNQ